jgi:hypothetical protein
MAETEEINSITFRQGKKSQIVRLAFLLRQWANKSLTLEATTDKETRKNINNWLNDFETTYKNEMLKIKESAGLFGYSIAQNDAKNIAAIDETALGIDTFLDKYSPSLDATNAIDSTNIRNFRNSLGTRWKSGYKSFYKEWNAVINRPESSALTFRQLTKQVRNKPWYRDLVSIVDGSGRKWNPDSYSAMYAATQSSTYQDNVYVSDIKASGIEYVEISNHNTDTPICKQYEGKTYALGSNSLGVPVLPVRTPFHPNCRHVTLTLRPEFAENYKETNANVDKEFKEASKDFSGNWRKTIDKQEKYNKTHRQPV